MSGDPLAAWAKDMGVPLDELRRWKAPDWQRHLDSRNAEAVVEAAALDLLEDLAGGAE